MYEDYINQHSKQDAERLGGAYGIKEGVNILPQSRTVTKEEEDEDDVIPVTVMNRRDETTGEDQMF